MGDFKAISEKMSPVLGGSSDQLSKLPNPVIFYLTELKILLLVYMIVPAVFELAYVRLFFIVLLPATTLLYFLWSMNEVNRRTSGLVELQRREKEKLKKESELDKSILEITKLRADLEEALADLDK
uniref:Endoplasmic reticulum transmembrane protein n=1 Tax=Rhodosorus marinus TaxID=101924 RepID=A0A7S0BF82_9RHOD|mmetsp:Transcript_12676/g.18337  ORF Transcript_12676/g.18337 Transcript_12676/m.18337 type:complete len:126 (+) Transcript_12676:119-496(+)|eukprot:CAMPEP_0184746934 /NCGR_PEP_ID=MMETSP0315-20130426/9399_1 /TAXON_ID=101924 /ORGANISM="Rhodosorus marinus, Strain UTEX LB 2760" /LENGTH=125 /DNA_ID=CAMNT_0027219685 /DNA_START=44 /DNA_END=421 /DNA_ORIENTATION=+